MRSLTRYAALAAIVAALALLIAGAGPSSSPSEAGSPITLADDFLRQNAGPLGLDPTLQDITPTEVRQGLSARHVRYRQTIDGTPIYGRTLTVSIPNDERPEVEPLVTGDYSPSTAATLTTLPMPLSGARNAVSRDLNLNPGNLRGEIESELVYYPLDDTRDTSAVLAWQVIAPTRDPLGTWLYLIRADTGAVLERNNLLAMDTGGVFDPNPVVTSGGLFPPPTNCDTPPNAATLAGEISSRTLLGINAGQSKLIGPYVDVTAPGIVGGYKTAGLANEPSGNYVYPCNDDRFEEVMVYRSVDTVQRKIKALGFTGPSGIVDYPIPAHAHYFSDCNAFYDPASTGIHFGDATGCVATADAAEDADVIIHEYGHALQHNQIPGWGFTLGASQARAMGEGFSDFLTAAIYGDPCLGEWFNLGRTACAGDPALRSLENSAVLSGSVVTNLPTWCSDANSPHCAGLVWGGALWDIVQALGSTEAARDTVLTLVLDSHFYLDPESGFEEAAAAIRQSDTLLYGGAHVPTIDAAFSARGISSLGPVSDFPYAFLYITHLWRGDLEVNLVVGPNPASPICTHPIWSPDPPDSGDDLLGYEPLNGSPCAGLLPPTPATPWHLEARDTIAVFDGNVERFELILDDASRCIATDTPVFIPDNDGYVYSTIDCSTSIGPPADSDGDTIPDITDTDDDNDGFEDTVELWVGTDQLVPCAFTLTANDEEDDRWPPDMNDDRRVNILDIIQLAPPVFNSNSSQPDYSARYDLIPDSVINILDIIQMTPPVFNTSC